MPTAQLEKSRLDEVRLLEHRRIQATRLNDVDALAPLLDDGLIYINSIGEPCDKKRYLADIESHYLTYEPDFEVRETGFRVFDDLVILVGIMLGHSRLDGERQAFRFSSLSVWRLAAGEWRMVAWQSSSASQPRNWPFASGGATWA